MKLNEELAKHIHQVFYGGNYTGSNLKDILEGITCEQAIHKTGKLNTIAALVFHIGYYFDAVNKLVETGELNAHDKFSYDLPPIRSEDDWKNLVAKLFNDAGKLESHIHSMSEETIRGPFTVSKYGTWHRNILGLIEHTHYHAGQIAILKRLAE